MLQGLHRANPIVGVVSEQPVDQVYGFWTYVGPLFIISSIFSLFHPFYYLIVVGPIEWRVTAQQDIKYDSNAP
jgi:hypothetical protein|tara:strand:- start:1252 stop:1470 length:219 start_codon:yes stop_codon:yes gene_type:complete